MVKVWKMICTYCGNEGWWKWDWPPSPSRHSFCNVECWEKYHIAQGDWDPRTIAHMEENRGD